MVLQTDGTGALSSYDDRLALVEAVYTAAPEDEGDWIEWKSTLDLGTPDGRFTFARSVLGFANRMPDAAARTAEGQAYLVIGVEPGQLTGVTRIDPSPLEAGLRPYLGSGPRWTHEYVYFHRRDVLVITVEAPQWGDPIHLLRRAYQPEARGGARRGAGADNGTIFVRRGASTVRADASEIELLQQRLLRTSFPSLQLGCVGTPPPIHAVACDAAARAAWLEQQRRSLEGMRAVPAPPTKNAEARQGITIAEILAAGNAPTQRAIDDWLQTAEEGLAEAIMAELLDGGTNCLELRLTNPTDRALPDTQLRLRFPAGVGVADPRDHRDYRALPARPRVTTPALSKHGGIPRDLLTVSPAPLLPRRQVWIHDASDESGELEVVFSVGDLRPQCAVRLDAVCLAPMVAGQPIVASWTATSSRIDGVARGELIIEVEDEPWQLSELLDP